MKHERVRQVNGIACGKFYRQGQIGDEDSRKRTKFYSKLVSCGKPMTINGKSLRYFCRLAACPYCSWYRSTRQANAFLSQFPFEENESFRMVTVGIDTCYEIEEIFWLFRTFRERSSKAIHNLRRRTSSSWREFSMCGSLEVDAYKVDDFSLLGHEKQQDFLDNYGFNPKHIGQDTLWHVTMHGVINVGASQENDITELLRRFSRTVHIKPLDVANSVSDNVCNILRYSNKVRWEIKHAGGKLHEWDYRQVEEYCRRLALLRGRQSHKMMIKRVSEK